MKTIKIIQLFENYNEAYQPYIPPVINLLKKQSNLLTYVASFSKSDAVDFVIPSNFIRRIKEKVYYTLRGLELNYFEILSLKKDTDIIHIQQSYLFSKVTGLLNLPKHKRPKIVITLRGSDTYVKPWVSQKWKNFYKTHAKNVDAFIVMSRHQKEYLNLKWNVPNDKIYIIPISYGNPFNVEGKQKDSKVLKVASAFRLCWEKNIDGNLRTINHLKNLNIPVLYSIYGDGKDKGQLVYLIDKYNLTDCVTFYGRQSHVNLKLELMTSDFYLQLSHSESLGMSVIEAQTLGLPAIVSNSDGLPEVIVNNKTGFCIDPNASEEAASKLIELWKNDILYESFSKEAISNSQEQFSLEKEVSSLRRLYHNLIDT